MVAGRGRSEGTRAGGRLPADACPFRRPFPPDFHDCVAYHPAWFVPLTSGYDAMTPVWTCSNLVAGARPQAAAHFYGRCRIGDEAARLAWVDTLHAKRLAGLRGLSVELTHATAALTAEMFAAKGAQLQAEEDGDERDQATARLRVLCRRWLAQLDAFLERQGGALRNLGFPPEAIRALVVDLLDVWAEQPHSGPPDISDEALRLFPEDVRILLRPSDDAAEWRAEG
jgi:hypothetical protein